MDPFQAATSLIEGVKALLQGVQALVQAARDLQDAPQKVKQLEQVLKDLERLHANVKHSYSNKLHHPELEVQLQSFQSLIREFEPRLQRAKKVATRRRKGVKMYLNAVVTAVVGDELTDIAKAMNLQLVAWIQRYSLSSTINKTFVKIAEGLPTYLRVQSEVSYMPLSKAARVRALLENSSYKVTLIHGLSGMGKSCLARYVAANPPSRFTHGAVELVLGQGCSKFATSNNRDEYHKRLAGKFGHLLRVLGRKKNEVDGLNLDDVCQLLQETLTGRSILVVLDDVWESDIIARFTRLYDNECKYLATTRNQCVYEITEAEKFEIGKEDVEDFSKAILMHHSQLTDEELPDVAERLIQRCGYHPLTLAVIGKALRGETRPEQWEKAIDDLRTYASQAPVPLHYLNEKEVESAATVFGSFDYSLNSMVPHAKDLFISFAALCWDGPIPEACLETMWEALEQNSTFRLVVGRLLEGSLLERASSDTFYRVHDMVALYLETKVDEARFLLLKHSKEEARAAVVPWLYHFGNKVTQKAAEAALVEVFWSNNEELPAIVLWHVVDVLSTSNTMIELETSSVNFSKLIGSELVRLFLLDSEDLHAAMARCIANCFTVKDYEQHTYALVQAGATEKLACLLKTYGDWFVQRDAGVVLVRLAEFRQDACEEILKEVPLKELLDLLDPSLEETHEAIISSVIRLAKAGEEVAIKQMFMAGVGKKLEEMLSTGSESAQQRAVVALKSFHELGGSQIVQSFLRKSGVLERSPWQVRLSLERLTMTVERKPSFKHRAPPKRHVVAQNVLFLRDGSEGEQLEALQDLAPVVEKVGDLQVMDIILSTNLIEVLATLLDGSFHNARIKSEACFVLVKLSSGGVKCIKSMLKMKVVENLVHMMSTPWREMQETAYSTLHNLIFTGRRLVIEHLLRANLVEKLLLLLESGMQSSEELGLYSIQDLVEVGGKECIERMLSLRVIDKLAALQSRSKFKEGVVEFAKVVRKCSGLSAQEHRVLSQQVLRQARGVLKDGSQMTKLNTMMRNSKERGEGSGSGSSKRRSSFSSSSN